MAVADVSVYEAALKLGWTQDQLEKQFYAEDPLLDSIQKETPITTIGKEALTPVWTGRGGGYSVVPPTGSAALNIPDSQELNQAKWKYRRHWKQIKIDTAAVTQTTGTGNAVASTVDTEVEGAISDTRKQITRQLFSDQTARIAQCATTASSTTVKLLSTGMGYQAIRNGWLVPGQMIDIGTKTEEGVIAADREILEVVENESEPKIKISGAAVEPGETHYVSIANARSGETSYENNGFGNIISETTTLGEINPSTVPGWKAVVDSEAAAITLGRIYKLQRRVRQKGERGDWAFTSLKQLENIFKLLQPQVRFAGADGSLQTGDGESVMVGNIKVQGHVDCPDQAFYLATKKHLFALRTDQPYWVPERYGKSILEWKQESTFLISALEYYFEMGVNRRNAFGAMTALT
jgi:hypothetical protein